jgi:glyoxylase-like metal-dependent hydrolase (beta-lactamase superfamily II)
VKAHLLNCGTMRMPTVPTLVSHVLLLETDAGLVLVDTGFGLEDIAGLARRLGWFRHVIRPVFSAEETPARQAGRLGFTQDDVRHIIITHFDMDHIGALADFPRAAVHATAAEARGATRPGSWLERQRYRFPQLAHGPKIVEHSPDGEMWRGFAAAREPAHIIHRGWPGSGG